MLSSQELLSLQASLEGAYVFNRELGRGGMGVVYLGRDVRLDRLVAIKVLPKELATHPRSRELFLAESRLAAALTHSHIVPIHHVGESMGTLYFVMAYVNGESLAERVRRLGPLSAREGSRLMREVASALAHAHARGIVHRDVKPDNILIEHDSGRALVADFGIASRVQADAVLAGSPGFMSPEQANGEGVDERSDIYSLGVTVHYAVTGVMPPECTVSIPRPLRSVIARSVALRADERWRAASEIVEALDDRQISLRTELPSSLRVWAEGRRPVGLVAAGWLALFAFVAMAEWRSGNVADSLVALALAMLPLLPAPFIAAWKTRRVLAAGYELTDLRYSLAVQLDDQRVRLAQERDVDRAWWARLLRITAFGGIGTLALVFQFMPRERHGLGLDTLLIALMGATIGSVAAARGLRIPLFGRRLSSLFSGAGLRRWFWGGALGRFAAGLLTPSQFTPAEVVRPEELALRAAVEELYGSMPDAYRSNLPDLPVVVANLARRAAEAWRLAQAGGDETSYSKALEALESIRADLLRLHAGDASVSSLTTLLDEARSLGAQIARLADAQSTLMTSPNNGVSVLSQ